MSEPVGDADFAPRTGRPGSVRNDPGPHERVQVGSGFVVGPVGAVMGTVTVEPPVTDFHPVQCIYRHYKYTHATSGAAQTEAGGNGIRLNCWWSDGVIINPF